MSRNIFGWDLPPGCSHRDVEAAMAGDSREPSALEEAVWDLIEKAGVPIEVNESVASILDEYFGGLAPPEDPRNVCHCGIAPGESATPGDHHDSRTCPLFEAETGPDGEDDRLSTELQIKADPDSDIGILRTIERAINTTGEKDHG